jgi:hypothetical protein
MTINEFDAYILIHAIDVLINHMEKHGKGVTKILEDNELVVIEEGIRFVSVPDVDRLKKLRIQFGRIVKEADKLLKT